MSYKPEATRHGLCLLVSEYLRSLFMSPALPEPHYDCDPVLGCVATLHLCGTARWGVLGVCGTEGRDGVPTK